MSSFTKFVMVAIATLMSSTQANACWFTGCGGGAPRTTFYAPVAPAPCATCNPCSTCAAPTTVGYAPYSVGYAPYTAYRPTLFGGYRPYTVGYAPYTAAYAPSYTSYSAGYAPAYNTTYSVGYTPYTSYYSPTTVLSPSCGCASPCSSCSTGTCNSCNTSVPSTTTFAPSSVTPTTYIQSTTTPAGGCSSCGTNSVTSTSTDNRYFTTGTTSAVSPNTTFANTNAGTQFVTGGSSEMRSVKPSSVQAQTPISEEPNRTETQKSSVDTENKTTLMPITNMHERLVEVPRISTISHATSKPAISEVNSNDGWGR